jgi:hypothetical protein
VGVGRIDGMRSKRAQEHTLAKRALVLALHLWSSPSAALYHSQS